MSSWWVTGFSTGSLKLTSWTPSDGEDQHWSLLWSAPQTEPLPSTGWFMAAHWCAQRANSSGTKQYLNAMSDKPGLALKTISKDPWWTEFWPHCVLFVVLSEVWTWLHVHKRLMISLLWGVGLPLTLQMAPLRLLQSLPMNQHDLRLQPRQPHRWKQLKPPKRQLHRRARKMKRLTWTRWQRNACQHLSRTKARALQNSQLTNGRRLHPVDLDFGQNLPVRLRNLLSLLIDRWTSRSRLSRQRSEIDSQRFTLESWNHTTPSQRNKQEPAEDDADRARERRHLEQAIRTASRISEDNNRRLDGIPRRQDDGTGKNRNKPKTEELHLTEITEEEIFANRGLRADLALKRRRAFTEAKRKALTPWSENDAWRAVRRGQNAPKAQLCLCGFLPQVQGGQASCEGDPTRLQAQGCLGIKAGH